MESRRGPGERAGLSPEAVVAAARDLLDADGAEALTMRAVADRLGVAPNALYSHVDGKGALVDAVLDSLLEDLDAPPPSQATSPGRALRALMADTYDVLVSHPSAVPLFVARGGARGANAERLGALMDDLLGRAGLTQARAASARRVLIVYAIGFAAFAARPPLEDRADPRLPTEELRTTFDAGLGWLLDGILAGRPRRGGSSGTRGAAPGPE